MDPWFALAPTNSMARIVHAGPAQVAIQDAASGSHLCEVHECVGDFFKSKKLVLMLTACSRGIGSMIAHYPKFFPLFRPTSIHAVLFGRRACVELEWILESAFRWHH